MRATVTVVPIIGLQAIAQPPIRERDHAYAMPDSTPSRMKLFFLRSGFFQSFQMQYRNRLRTQPSMTFSFCQPLPN